MTNIEEWDKIKKHIDDVKGIDVYKDEEEAKRVVELLNSKTMTKSKYYYDVVMVR